MIACAPPLPPCGYIGCAASPSSVTRPKRPARKRIAVDHRIGEDRVGLAHHRRHVEPVERPVPIDRKEIVEPAGLFQSTGTATSRSISATQLTSWLPAASILSYPGPGGHRGRRRPTGSRVPPVDRQAHRAGDRRHPLVRARRPRRARRRRSPTGPAVLHRSASASTTTSTSAATRCRARRRPTTPHASR